MLPSLEALASLDREAIIKWMLLGSILHSSPPRSRAVGSLRSSRETDRGQHGNISADLSGKFLSVSALIAKFRVSFCGSIDEIGAAEVQCSCELKGKSFKFGQNTDSRAQIFCLPFTFWDR